MSVSREKYEATREKGKKWKARVDDFEALRDEYYELEFNNSELVKESLKIKGKLSELETKNKDLEKALKLSAQSISRKISDAEERVGRDKVKLETELILKDGEVRRLQASLEDTKENLKDMKDDNRDLRKALRDNK
jgi:predicted  nucleic acid-binding Zn-ribbon protein